MFKNPGTSYPPRFHLMNRSTKLEINDMFFLRFYSWCGQAKNKAKWKEVLINHKHDGLSNILQWHAHSQWLVQSHYVIVTDIFVHQFMFMLVKWFFFVKRFYFFFNISKLLVLIIVRSNPLLRHFVPNIGHPWRLLLCGYLLSSIISYYEYEFLQ